MLDLELSNWTKALGLAEKGKAKPTDAAMARRRGDFASPLGGAFLAEFLPNCHSPNFCQTFPPQFVLCSQIYSLSKPNSALSPPPFCFFPSFAICFSLGRLLCASSLRRGKRMSGNKMNRANGLSWFGPNCALIRLHPAGIVCF